MTFQQSGKQDFLKYILKSSASMHKSSGSHFFRATTGIKWKLDVFDASRSVIAFLTNLRITRMLSNFRVHLKRKAGKEIPESSKSELFEKNSAKNLALSDAEDNSSGLLKQEGIQILHLLRTLFAIPQKSQEPSFWYKIDSLVSLTKTSLAASITLLQWLLAQLNLNLDAEHLGCWCTWKKWFLRAMAAADGAENHEDK